VWRVAGTGLLEELTSVTNNGSSDDERAHRRPLGKWIFTMDAHCIIPGL
jgi:hypothetical protein